MGEEIEVKILRVDSEDRKIGLSLKRAQWAAEDREQGKDDQQEPVRRRGGLEGDTGLSISMDDKIIQPVRQDQAGQDDQQPASAEPDGTEQVETEATVQTETDPTEAEPIKPEADEDDRAEETPAEDDSASQNQQ